MSVPDPTVLNQYASFSSETYGETNFKQMEVILNELTKQGKWQKNEIFVDLGSGIGSIAMQAAACCHSLKYAIGIEIQENPNKIASTMMKKFEYLCLSLYKVERSVLQSTLYIIPFLTILSFSYH